MTRQSLAQTRTRFSLQGGKKRREEIPGNAQLGGTTDTPLRTGRTPLEENFKRFFKNWNDKKILFLSVIYLILSFKHHRQYMYIYITVGFSQYILVSAFSAINNMYKVKLKSDNLTYSHSVYIILYCNFLFYIFFYCHWLLLCMCWTCIYVHLCWTLYFVGYYIFFCILHDFPFFSSSVHRHTHMHTQSWCTNTLQVWTSVTSCGATYTP